jgi:TM2 domain-containing membrane protein YozV/ribosomal protein L40E
MAVFCTKCGAQNIDGTQVCFQCQATLPLVAGYQPTYQTPSDYQGYQPIQPPAPMMYGESPTLDWERRGADKKIAAGICAILVGAFGVHKFILGYQTEGIIMLLVSLLSCGTLAFIMSIIGIVEGIMYLTKSDEEFVRTYVEGRKGWF